MFFYLGATWKRYSGAHLFFDVLQLLLQFLQVRVGVVAASVVHERAGVAVAALGRRRSSRRRGVEEPVAAAAAAAAADAADATAAATAGAGDAAGSSSAAAVVRLQVDGRPAASGRRQVHLHSAEKVFRYFFNFRSI